MALYSSALSNYLNAPAATAKTIVQVLAGTQPLAVKEFGISFQEVNSALTPAKVQLIRQTTAGTMTASGDPKKYYSADTGCLASYSRNASAEPTGTTDVYESYAITPIGGLFLKQWPLGQEIRLAPGERLGVVVTAGADSAASVLCHVVFEE